MDLLLSKISNAIFKHFYQLGVGEDPELTCGNRVFIFATKLASMAKTKSCDRYLCMMFISCLASILELKVECIGFPGALSCKLLAYVPS